MVTGSWGSDGGSGERDTEDPQRDLGRRQRSGGWGGSGAGVWSCTCSGNGTKGVRRKSKKSLEVALATSGNNQEYLSWRWWLDELQSVWELRPHPASAEQLWERRRQKHKQEAQKSTTHKVQITTWTATHRESSKLCTPPSGHRAADFTERPRKPESTCKM